MATFLSRVEDLVGTFADITALDQWLTDDARKLVDIMPLSKAYVYSSNLSINVNSGVNVLNYRVLSVNGDSYGSISTDESLETQVSLSGSLNQATLRSPRHIVKNGTLKIYPNTLSVGRAVSIAYPTVVNTDSTISVLPNDLIDALVYKVSSRCANYNANVIITTSIPASKTLLGTYTNTDEDIELSNAESQKLQLLYVNYDKFNAQSEYLDKMYQNITSIYLSKP